MMNFGTKLPKYFDLLTTTKGFLDYLIFNISQKPEKLKVVNLS